MCAAGPAQKESQPLATTPVEDGISSMIMDGRMDPMEHQDQSMARLCKRVLMRICHDVRVCVCVPHGGKVSRGHMSRHAGSLADLTISIRWTGNSCLGSVALAPYDTQRSCVSGI